MTRLSYQLVRVSPDRYSVARYKRGNLCKNVPPLYDATLADIDGTVDLLEAYLKKFDTPSAHSVVFYEDGARSCWKRFPLLAQKLGIKSHYEIIDYTHANQNL